MQKRGKEPQQSEKKDHGTPELAQQHTLEIVNNIARVKDQCTIDVCNLNFPGLYDAFTRRQSAERIYSDFVHKGAEPRITANYGRDVAGTGTGMSEFQMVAHINFRNAMDALSRISQDIILHLCCYNFSLRKYSQEKQWNHKNGFASARLCEALDDLSVYYESLTKKR